MSLNDVMNIMFYELESNCATIPMWKTVCADNASSCQLANVEIQTSEDAIVILSQSLFSMRRVCEMPDYPTSDESIKRYHNGLSWSTGQGINEQYTFLKEMLESYHSSLIREKRFVMSEPIAIATAIEVLSSASAVTASYALAKSESNRVSKEQNILRGIDSHNAILNNVLNNNVSVELGKSIDSLRYQTALAAQTTNNHHSAIQHRNKINHLFSTAKTLSFNDPETERWYTTIEKIVNDGIQGFTKSEYKEATYNLNLNKSSKTSFTSSKN